MQPAGDEHVGGCASRCVNVMTLTVVGADADLTLCRNSNDPMRPCAELGYAAISSPRAQSPNSRHPGQNRSGANTQHSRALKGLSNALRLADRKRQDARSRSAFGHWRTLKGGRQVSVGLPVRHGRTAVLVPTSPFNRPPRHKTRETACGRVVLLLAVVSIHSRIVRRGRRAACAIFLSMSLFQSTPAP